jgi:hypothetical protein
MRKEQVMKDERSVKSKVITLRVTPVMYRRMERAAKHEHLSVPDWQRDLLVSALRAHDKGGDASGNGKAVK